MRHHILCTQEKYAPLDIYDILHHVTTVTSATIVIGKGACLCTHVANISQMKIKIKLRMTLSLHAPFTCIKWQIISFHALQKTKSFDKMCLKFQLLQYTKACSSYSPLWQMAQCHRVSCATVILSGIIITSLCTVNMALVCPGMRIFRKKHDFMHFWSKFMHVSYFSGCFGPFWQDFLLFFFCFFFVFFFFFFFANSQYHACLLAMRLKLGEI